MAFHKPEKSKVSWIIGRRIPPSPIISVVFIQWQKLRPKYKDIIPC